MKKTMLASSEKIYKCSLQWKNRIGMTSKQEFKPKEGKNRWKLIVQNRMRNYLKLYSCFRMYSTYFLVAHRNLVSVFDLKTKEWQQNMEFDDFVQYLARCDKNTKLRYTKAHTEHYHKQAILDDFTSDDHAVSNVATNVAVVVGNSMINQIKENKSGKKSMLFKSDDSKQLEGRALSWHDD